jgi:hypothetical protein
MYRNLVINFNFFFPISSGQKNLKNHFALAFLIFNFTLYRKINLKKKKKKKNHSENTAKSLLACHSHIGSKPKNITHQILHSSKHNVIGGIGLQFWQD